MTCSPLILSSMALQLQLFLPLSDPSVSITNVYNSAPPRHYFLFIKRPGWWRVLELLLGQGVPWKPSLFLPRKGRSRNRRLSGRFEKPVAASLVEGFSESVSRLRQTTVQARLSGKPRPCSDACKLLLAPVLLQGLMADENYLTILSGLQEIERKLRTERLFGE